VGAAVAIAAAIVTNPVAKKAPESFNLRGVDRNSLLIVAIDHPNS
jgi:hypothetical protein